MSAGYVYMVHGVGTNFIKIGMTSDLSSRLRQIEQGVPFKIRLLSAQLVHNAQAAESSLLAQYAIYKTRGEWFALPKEVMQQWPIEEQLMNDYDNDQGQIEATEWLSNYFATRRVVGMEQLSKEAKAAGHSFSAMAKATRVLGLEIQSNGLVVCNKHLL